MTVVFFLFLTHLGLGLLATLPLVPDRAGTSYFKFCSAAAALAMTAAVALLVRRFGLVGGAAWPEATYRPLLVASTASLIFAVLYNRAHHFSWRRLSPVLLGGSLAAGAAGVALSAPPADRILVGLTDLTSILLLGAATSAMVLGHWYLVVLDLPIKIGRAHV